jgi:hypothetical protein
MTSYVWSDVRERASRRFGGQLPHGEVEAAIVAVFEGQPQHVLDAIDHVAQLFEQGRVRSPWALVRSHLERAEEAGRVAASGKVERAQRIVQAEEWIRHAGLHFDREDEVVDELFGERGRLKAWTDDAELRDRLLDLWRERRPSGERVEADAERRMREYGALRKQLGEAKRQVAALAARREEEP